jgi:hypothetical protein
MLTDAVRIDVVGANVGALKKKPFFSIGRKGRTDEAKQLQNCVSFRYFFVNGFNFQRFHFRSIMKNHTLKKYKQLFVYQHSTYIDKSVGQSYNLYLNVAHFFNTSVN